MGMWQWRRRRMPAAGTVGKGHAGDVLELRVHGVNNTTPEGMLDLPQESVEEVLGDDLAGFYRPKPDALTSVHEGDRGWVPADVTREAYSWGGLARSSPGGIGGGTVARVTSTVGRVSWTLLLPFGLTNIAYWTRRLDGGVPVADAGGPADPSAVSAVMRGGGRNGPGAGMIRAFGLGLTLLVVISACEVSMDLVGNQCFVAGPGAGTPADKVCGRLPGVAGFLGRISVADRLVATSLLPIVLLLVFWLLASVTRARYERVTPEGPKRVEQQFKAYQFLQLPGFWSGDRMVGQAAQLHLGAGLAVVSLALAWPAAFGPSDGCLQPTDLFGGSCWTQVSHRGGDAWTFVILAAVAILVVLAALLITWLSAHQIADVRGATKLGTWVSPSDDGSSDRRLHYGGTPLLLAGVAAVLATEIAMLVVQPAVEAVGRPSSGELALAHPLLGVSALPTVVVSSLLAVAVAGFMLRKISEAWLIWLILLLSFTVVVERGPDGLAGPCLVAVAIVATILLRTVPPRPGTRLRLSRHAVPAREVSADLLARVAVLPVVALWVGALVVLWTETDHEVVAVACALGALVLLASMAVESDKPGARGFGRLPSGDRRLIAWRGTAPGMFLGLAFLTQAAVCSLLVLVAGDWLNGNNSASTLLPRSNDRAHDIRTIARPLSTSCGGLCPIGDPRLVVPRPYLLMGTGILLTLELFGLLVGAMLLTTRKAGAPRKSADVRPGPRRTPPAAADAGAGTRAAVEPADGPPADPRLDHYPEALTGHVLDTVVGKRRTAAIAHRAEAMVGYLAVIGLVVSFGVVLASLYPFDIWGPTGDLQPQWLQHLLQTTTNVSTIALAAVGTALLATLAGGAVSVRKRPLGLVWDLVCFLPRAAHPFSPPCYAERAVPELASRIDWWLARDGSPTWVDSQRRRGRRGVVSAHSLGGVLTVAAVLASRPVQLRYPQVALLTYGSQLRAYFSRIFPELIGHRVLGVPATRAGSFWRRDPWEKELDDGPADTADPVDPGSVFEVLSPGDGEPPSAVGWRNLWRRTDYLGFPVYSYRAAGEPPEGNPLDRMAEELDDTSYLAEVGTHSNYFRTRRYLQVLERLSSRP